MTAGAALSLALLPALWVDPFAILLQLSDWTSVAAADGHEIPIFFMGEVHEGEPGALFYPISLLWRLTPIAIVGVILFTAHIPIGIRRGWINKEMAASLLIHRCFRCHWVAADVQDSRDIAPRLAPARLTGSCGRGSCFPGACNGECPAVPTRLFQPHARQCRCCRGGYADGVGARRQGST